jgi:hypothetical protein
MGAKGWITMSRSIAALLVWEEMAMRFEEPLAIAENLLRRHGNAAVAIARERSFALRSRGEMDRYVIWRRIYQLLRELRRTGVRFGSQVRA